MMQQQWSWPDTPFTVDDAHALMVQSGCLVGKSQAYVYISKAVESGVLKLAGKKRGRCGRRNVKMFAKAAVEVSEWRYEQPDSPGLWWMAICSLPGVIDFEEAVHPVWTYLKDGKLFMRHMEHDSREFDLSVPHLSLLLGDVLWSKAEVPPHPKPVLAESVEEAAARSAEERK